MGILAIKRLTKKPRPGFSGEGGKASGVFHAYAAFYTFWPVWGKIR
jgi:hypothetical protein